jgi:hypothetical protein
LIVLTLLIVASAVLLTPWLGFFEYLYLWPRIALPALLLVGLAGAVWRMKPLLVVGKMGAWAYILYAVANVPEPEDLRYAGILRYPIGSVAPRFLLLLAVAVAMLICFRQLGRRSTPRGG